jgi:GYF domain 2
MSDQWYFGYSGSRYGPFSAAQLRELADTGRIQPMDTIWKEGMATGVAAHRVKNLFPDGELAEEQTQPHEPQPTNESVEIAGVANEELHERTDEESEEATRHSEVDEATPPPEKPPRPVLERKGRATAIRGAIIASQDGTTVYYRKKCIKCGFEETGRNRLPIRNGVTRSTYFCPKCRKVRPVEIQGSC